MLSCPPKRLIARLDVKSENLIKGVHLEGLRVLGDPQDFAMQYYNDGADEIIYLDIVASLYGRSNLLEIVKKTAQNIHSKGTKRKSCRIVGLHPTGQ